MLVSASTSWRSNFSSRRFFSHHRSNLGAASPIAPNRQPTSTFPNSHIHKSDAITKHPTDR